MLCMFFECHWDESEKGLFSFNLPEDVKKLSMGEFDRVHNVYIIYMYSPFF